MPTIYRSMLEDGGKPQIGNSAQTLGVRTEGEHHDIPVNSDSMVEPKTGGMSVSPTWRQLPVFRIPSRLRHLFPSASGNNNLKCWQMGEGPFAEGQLVDKLWFRPDPGKPDAHGFVEPNKQMELSEYQSALTATQDQWVVDEE